MKNLLKRWIKKWKDILINLVSYIGIFWLFVEITSYSTSGSADTYLKNVQIFLLMFALMSFLAVYVNKPKTRFGCHLRGKDHYIEIKVGDAFENQGALVVPVNDQFDMLLGGNVLKAKSIQNSVIEKYYSGKVEHLNADITKSVQIGTKHEIGKTIEVEQQGKRFYLLVNSIKKDNNRVKSEIDDFLQALNGLWAYLAGESSRDSAVTIPIMNTQHGRDSYLSRMTAIKEIITSYIESSKDLNICEKLIISIFPDDLQKGNLDLDELDEYVRYACKHYRQVILREKKEGEEVTTSKVIKIEN